MPGLSDNVKSFQMWYLYNILHNHLVASQDTQPVSGADPGGGGGAGLFFPFFLIKK